MPAIRLIAVGIVSTLALGLARTGDQADLARLLAQYRGTEADRAIAEFASWSDARTLREAALPPTPDDPMALAALALFHLEAGLLKAGFKRDDTGILPRRLLANGDAGLTIIERLMPLAKASTDPKFLAFCRDWYVAVNTVVRNTPGWTWDGAIDLESPQKHFGDDSQILALLGTRAAAQMGPWRLGGGPYGFGSAFDLAGRRLPTLTADGETYTAEDVRSAETFFRRALASNPSFAEARLRLARVLQLTNRRREAIVEFQRTSIDAAAMGDRFTGYLAALFRGQALEDGGELPAAISAYETAIARYPSGVIAKLALGQALLVSGQADDGWAVSRSIFEASSSSRVRDPWVLFSAFGFHQTTARLGRMRALVSETPLRSFPLGSQTPELLARESPVAADAPLLATRSEGPSFRGGVDAVRVEAFVTTDDGPVTALSARDFIVSDSGVSQRVTESARAGKLAVAVVVDSSDSMGHMSSWARVQTVTAAISRALSPDDIVSVVTVADRIELKADRRPGSDRVGQLFATLEPEAHSLTSIWDGVMAGMSLVAHSPGRSLVVVVSDGFDNASWFNRKRTIERLKRLGVPVDAITVPWRDSYTDGFDIAAGDVRFYAPVTASGGREFLATDPELEKTLAQRFSALRESYVLLYTPENVEAQQDGWHDITVTLRPGVKGKVQARPGYYAPVKK